MDKYRVTLTAEERADLEHLVSSGKGAARRLTHARILLLADAAVSGRHTDEQIVAALGVGICTVGRVRRPPTLAEALQAAEVTGLRQQTFLLLPDTRQGVTLLSRAGLGQLPR